VLVVRASVGVRYNPGIAGRVEECDRGSCYQGLDEEVRAGEKLATVGQRDEDAHEIHELWEDEGYQVGQQFVRAPLLKKQGIPRS
jgi:hypothetical protein